MVAAADEAQKVMAEMDDADWGRNWEVASVLETKAPQSLASGSSSETFAAENEAVADLERHFPEETQNFARDLFGARFLAALL
jgi:hypothetical protein